MVLVEIVEQGKFYRKLVDRRWNGDFFCVGRRAFYDAATLQRVDLLYRPVVDVYVGDDEARRGLFLHVGLRGGYGQQRPVASEIELASMFVYVVD